MRTTSAPMVPPCPVVRQRRMVLAGLGRSEQDYGARFRNSRASGGTRRMTTRHAVYFPTPGSVIVCWRSAFSSPLESTAQSLPSGPRPATTAACWRHLCRGGSTSGRRLRLLTEYPSWSSWRRSGRRTRPCPRRMPSSNSAAIPLLEGRERLRRGFSASRTASPALGRTLKRRLNAYFHSTKTPRIRLARLRPQHGTAKILGRALATRVATPGPVCQVAAAPLPGAQPLSSPNWRRALPA